MTGSDPAAYAKLYPNCAAAAGQPVSALTPTTSGCNDSLIRFPALPALNEKDVDTERLGLTAAFQLQISDRTRLTIDGLYSRFESVTTNYGLSPVGLNRNNTNASYAYGANVPTATARNGSAMTAAQRRALYPGACTFAEETELNPGQDCGQSLNGAAPLPGYSSATTPTTSIRTSTTPTPPRPVTPVRPSSLPFRGDLIGRPSVKLLDAEVVGQNAEYLKLGNVDWRSAADRGAYTTDFRQVSVGLTHEFNDRFRGEFSAGLSESTNKNQGTLVEFNYMDAQEPFIFDERGANGMPKFDAGFNAADPNKWGIVKGFSAMRNYERETVNTYKGLKADFTYEWTTTGRSQFGGTGRSFEFTTNQFERNNDTAEPDRARGRESASRRWARSSISATA
jgi:iron complex outermembrane receptor protein